MITYSTDKLVKLRIIKDTQWSEYIVKWYDRTPSDSNTRWVFNESKSYNSGGVDPDHHQDARETLAHMLAQYNNQHPSPDPVHTLVQSLVHIIDEELLPAAAKIVIHDFQRLNETLIEARTFLKGDQS